MAEKTDSSREAVKTREKGTLSEEIELALTQLQEIILRVAGNFNVLISDITGDPPENYLEDKGVMKIGVKEPAQVPLLVVLRESPDQLRSMSEKLTEIDKRIEYLRGLLTGTLT